MFDVRIVVPDDELGDAVQFARNTQLNHTVEPKAQVVDGFTAVLLAGGITMVGKFIVDQIERHKGGSIIDLRTNPPSAQRDKGLAYGHVVIITPDGKVTVEVKDAPKDASERLLGTIIKGLLGD